MISTLVAPMSTSSVSKVRASFIVKVFFLGSWKRSSSWLMPRIFASYKSEQGKVHNFVSLKIVQSSNWTLGITFSVNNFSNASLTVATTFDSTYRYFAARIRTSANSKRVREPSTFNGDLNLTSFRIAAIM